jgi:hypothetical protein
MTGETRDLHGLSNFRYDTTVSILFMSHTSVPAAPM